MTEVRPGDAFVNSSRTILVIAVDKYGSWYLSVRPGAPVKLVNVPTDLLLMLLTNRPFERVDPL